MNMVNATHTEAVSVLKNMKEVCLLVVSREVLVVMPDEPAEEGGEFQDTLYMYILCILMCLTQYTWCIFLHFHVHMN